MCEGNKRASDLSLIAEALNALASLMVYRCGESTQEEFDGIGWILTRMGEDLNWILNGEEETRWSQLKPRR